MGISVVIPVRDEEQSICMLLDSLLAQTRQPDEVVIVDGGSKDGTTRIIESYIDRGFPIRLIATDHAYPGEARNLGVHHARHDIVAFTDAGIRLDPRWLEKLSEPLKQDSSVDVVYGTYEPVLNSFFTECAALTYVPAPANRNGCLIRGPSLASSLMRKSVWEAAGGFPPFRASEDLIFMEVVEQKGFKIAYAPEAVVYWQMPPGWNGTFRRFAVYSYHNLVAKRGHYWHRGVARQYLMALPFIALALFHHPLWWLVPVAGFLARVGWTLWRKRNGFAIPKPLQPRRWVMVGLILLLVDAATFIGAVTYYWRTGASKFRPLKILSKTVTNVGTLDGGRQ
jgi:glycosyltransferase involved in cell wall biosynthesis